MASIGDVLLKVLLDGSQVQTDAQRIGGQAGQTMGQRLSGGLKAGMAVGAIAGGVAAALAPIATAADDALDAVRAGTGATGEALDALHDDMRAVAGQVPDTLSVVGQTLADVNTRTGLTGEALQGLTERILDFSRATDSDAVANVALLTRVFGDWDVATEHQSETLDMFLRASQATGIGVDRLQNTITQFGAPMRQMGFSLEESTALLGKWEKEGVNVDTILAALKIGVSNFAREGKDASTGLADFVAEMEELGPGADATLLAIEKFGSRAGPDMAAAVAEGRFAIDDYLAAITNGEETVESVTAATEDAADGFAGFLNTATLALGEFAAPLAGFSEIAGPLLFALPLMTSAVGGLAGMITGVAVPALMTVGRVILGLIAGTGPIGLIILAIGALFLVWETNFLGIRDIIENVFGWIGDVALPWISGIFDAIAGAVSAAVGVIVGVIEGIVGVVSTVADAIGGLFSFITGGTNTAKSQIDSVGAKASSTPIGQFSPANPGGTRPPGYASGTMSVPSTGLAILHAGEMVVPQPAASALRDWFGSGFSAMAMAGEGGGGDTINVNVQGLMRGRSTDEIGAGLKRLSLARRLGKRRRFEE